MIEQIPLWWHFDLYRWQDVIEVVLLSGLFYYICRWLSQDKHKPLLLIFSSYCTAFLVADYASLTTLSTLLLLFLPILCAVFLIIHHHTLQKNFISLHAITPLQKPAPDWIEALVRAGLAAASDNRSFTCIIEKKQALDTLVGSGATILAPLSVELLRLVGTSSLYNSEQMLWIDAHARIHAYNCSWQKNTVTEWLSQEVKEQEQWLRDALFFTTKSDALFIRLSPSTRTFTLIAHGKIIQQAAGHHACSTMRTYLGYTPHSLKGDWYVPFGQNGSSQQSRP